MAHDVVDNNTEARNLPIIPKGYALEYKLYLVPSQELAVELTPHLHTHKITSEVWNDALRADISLQ